MMLWMFVACAQKIDLTVSPSSLDLGTVDFAVEMPTEGYNPLPVTITNNGKEDVELTVRDDDPDHLCLQGYTTFEAPFLLGTVPEGQSFTFEIAACDYDAGERDSLVETAVVLATGGDPATVEIPVSFTPTRTIDDGT